MSFPCTANSIVSLSIALGTDASKFDPDGPLPEIPDSNASKSGRERAIAAAKRDNLTVRQLAQRMGGYSGLAMIGTAKTIADEVASLTIVMRQPEYTATGFKVTVPSQSGRVYRLEYKNSMADATWTPLPLVAGNGTDLVLTDLAVVNSQRFYRVRRW